MASPGPAPPHAAGLRPSDSTASSAGSDAPAGAGRRPWGLPSGLLLRLGKLGRGWRLLHAPGRPGPARAARGHCSVLLSCEEVQQFILSRGDADDEPAVDGEAPLPGQVRSPAGGRTASTAREWSAPVPGLPCRTESDWPSSPVVKAKPWRRSQVGRRSVLHEEGGDALAKRAQCLTSFTFQQPLNCCGVTSVAYVLTALLGKRIEVDDILLKGGADVDSVVEGGMTLAELHDVCLRYISCEELPVFAECYHFDAHSVSHDTFLEACASDNVSGEVVLNFHSAIAHGKPKAEGGGHFSVMVGMLPKDRQILVADVHPMRYGAFWSCPLKQMFKAMRDKDSCGRARGLIHLGLLRGGERKLLPRLVPSTVDWLVPPPPYERAVLQRYVPRRLRDGAGAPNMAGASALALAVRLLEGEAAPLARHDEVMRALQESYTFHLNNFLTPAHLLRLAGALCDRGLLGASASLRPPPARHGGGALLREELAAAGCGEEGVVVLAAYDANEVHGVPLVAKGRGEASALSHGTSSWSVLAAFDPRAPPGSHCSLLVAPAHGLRVAGRLWAGSLDGMAAAMRALDCDGAGSLLVIKRTPHP